MKIAFVLVFVIWYYADSMTGGGYTLAGLAFIAGTIATPGMIAWMVWQERKDQ